jgi:hypothetical protein
VLRTDHIERQLRERVTSAVTEFYDRILNWVDDYARREGVTLDERKRRGHELVWEDGSVQFIRIENGAVKVLKGFRLEIGTNVTVPFIGNVN